VHRFGSDAARCDAPAAMTSPASIPNRFARVAGVVAALIGAGVLLGWAFRIPFLETVIPGERKMSASTAFCFVIAGVSLWRAAQGHAQKHSFRSRLASAGAGIIALIAALKLIEHATGHSLGVDTLLFAEPPGLPLRAEMAPATAFDFLLFGSALLVARTRFLGLFQSLSLLGGLVAWLGLSHYLYGGAPLLAFAAMAVHTAAGFFILNAGILCLRSDGGLVALLVSDSPGGVVARRLVPAALFVPAIIGWLRLEAQRAGWFGTEAGISLFALANIVVFGGLIWMNAVLLRESDAERKHAERRALAQLERLSLLQQITRAIGERQDMQSIFQAAIQRLEDHLPMEFCCVCLYDAAANELAVTAAGLKSSQLAAGLELNPGAIIGIDPNGLSRCIRGQLVYEPDVAQVQFPFPQRLAREGLHALVAAPLVVESQVFGLLVVARRQAESFSSGDCEFLRQLSEHVALAAHQAELHTALKQAYDDLRTTQDAAMQQERLRALGQMASGIAHDINNAVSPVALYTEMLLEKEQNLSARTRQYLEITQRAIGDVTHTVSRMGEFYRKREPALQLVSTDLNQLIQQVVDLTRARWSDMPQQRGIVIDVRQDLAPQLPAVAAVESEVREALTNLVFNAVDAMPEGGTLTLRTISISGQVRVEIADTGAGMDEETRRRCLEPFFTTKGDRGTGLGLAMVYGIVRRHNADLEIESRIGEGTTIRLVFPAAVAGGVAQASAASAPPTRRRILVVDDDPLLIKSLREALEDDGHTVVTASSGQEGIDIFRAAQAPHQKFGVVITDLGMPYIDGRKVAAAVKAASPLTPVILLTGWGQRLVIEGEVPPHVDCVLNKPPKLRDLREALNRSAASAK
jgi:signal transduction histidine kinase/ActR/RegA family two-component response regulator